MTKSTYIFKFLMKVIVARFTSAVASRRFGSARPVSPSAESNGHRRRPSLASREGEGYSPLHMTKVATPRWGWALTGSGHFFKECLAMIGQLEDVDLFVSRAAAEVVRMYKQELVLPKSARVFRDT